MLFKDAKNSRNLDVIIFVIVTTLLVAYYKLAKTAIKAGRIVELVISTLLLVASVFFSNYFICMNCDFFSLKSVFWCCSIPLAIFSLYWIILLNFFPKITCEKVNLNWANKEWWWSLDGWEFEEEVARIFRLNGYKAKVTKKTGDGGIDIIMYKDNNKYAVQCKHYKNQVPVETMRALNGVKQDFGADILVMVASSGVTKAGHEFTESKPYIKVYTLDDIIQMGLRPMKNGVEDTYTETLDDKSIPIIFRSI